MPVVGCLKRVSLITLLWCCASTTLAGAESRPAPAVPREEGGRPQTLSLTDAVHAALAKHPRLDQSRERLHAAEARTDREASVLLPQIDGVLNSSSGSARTNTSFSSGAIIENPNSNQVTGGLLLNQLLYDFGRTAYRIRANVLAAEAREYELATACALTAFRVERAYFDALKQRQLVRIADQTLRERTLIRDLVGALHERGRRPKLDVSLAEVEVSNARLQRLRAQRNFNVGLETLRNAIGLAEQQAFLLEDPGGPVRDSPSLRDLLVMARRHRPELRALESQLAGRRAAVTSAARQAYPSLNAIASTGQSAISDRNGKWWYGAFGSLSIPLFTGGRIASEVREATAAQSETEARLRELGQDVELQVIAAYHTVTALKEEVGVAREQVAIARTALDLARERLRLGLGSIVEVTQAEVALTRAETGLAGAQFDLLAAEAAQRYAIGRTLAQYGLEP